jgi:DHA3 family tetracycline resistance protein-like MFS transporter
VTRNGFAALRSRDFRLLWFGQGVSLLGDGIYTIALIVEALHIDNRPQSLALVLAARTVPMVLLLPVAGVVVDRVSRRQAMIVTDVVRGAAVAALAVLAAGNLSSIAVLVVVSVVFGAADAFFGPAVNSILPELLSDDLITQGNALRATTSQFASALIGPAVGGVLVGVMGVPLSFGSDAASFAVSTLCLVAIGGRPAPERTGRSFWADARTGLDFIRRRRWLLATMIAASAANFFGLAPIEVLIPLLVSHTLHAGALPLGLVLAADGLGGFVSSLVVARLRDPARPMVRMWVIYGLSGFVSAAMALSTSPAVAGVLGAITFALLIYGDVLFFSTMQRLVPRDMHGRTFAAIQIFAVALMPIGTLLAGVTAADIGVRLTLALSGLLSGASILVLLFPDVRVSDLAVESMASSPADAV